MNRMNAGGENRDWFIFGTAAAALLTLLSYHHSATAPGGALRLRAENRARENVSAWPEPSRRMAALLIERHGPPDRRAPGLLAWNQRKPWKRIAVLRAPSDSPLEQTLSYDVPPGRIAPLLAFGRGVSVNPDAWELSAQADGEAGVFLKLNLADDIAQGRLSPEEAEAVYRKVSRLRSAGKSSPYTEGLLFPAIFGDRPAFAYRTMF